MADGLNLIIKASYCFKDDVMAFARVKGGVMVILRPNKNWIDFNSSKGNIKIKVTEDTSKISFNVTGEIKVNRNKFTKVSDIPALTFKRILIKYETVMGDVLVVGDPINPIVVRREMIVPSTANESGGVVYSLDCVMSHPELYLL